MAEQKSTSYERHFYEWADEAASTAADVVVPIVLGMFRPRSVIDVGCGTGAWLRAFVDRGVTDVVGMDSPRVPLDLLRIDPDRFRTVDLLDPPANDRDFDLAVSLEVAEHLPAEAADPFVSYLCSLAPVVLFSAAIPGQEGELHVNEQWPSYWATRFATRGFEPVDVLRPLLWDNEQVAWFYRQNVLIYVRSADRRRLSIDVNVQTLPSPPMALVHPVTFTSFRQRAERKLATPLSFSAHVRALPSTFRRAVARRIGSTSGP